MIAAVTQHGCALEHAAKALRSDRDVMLAAVLQDGRALQHADEFLLRSADLDRVVEGYRESDVGGRSVLRDRDLLVTVYSLRAAVRDNKAVADSESHRTSKQDYLDLLVASRCVCICDDPEVVMAALSQDGSALQYADTFLRTNRDFIMAAVTRNSSALQYADKSLRKDRDVVMAAVTQNGDVLKDADKSLLNDRDLVLVAVTQNGSALQYADVYMQTDRDVVLAAVTQNSLG